jgi:hypothetical protein
MLVQIFAVSAGLILASSHLFAGGRDGSNDRIVGTWMAITGPLKQLTLGADGTASLMPFVHKPDYLLSGTFDCIDGIVHLRFTFPYCHGAGSESMFYQCAYEAHLEEDELVVSQIESFAGDCREPDFRCRKEPKGWELPVTSYGLRESPHAAWVWK